MDMLQRSIGIGLIMFGLGIAGAFVSTYLNGKVAAIHAVVAMHIDTPIRIDGNLDDAAWSAGVWTSAFIYSDGRAPAPRSCRAKILWSDVALFVAFQVEDNDLQASHTLRDEPLYTQDVVELFIDPEGDAKGYMEFEVSPRGTLFDARFQAYRSDLERAKEFNASSFDAAVQVSGTLDDALKDSGYTVEMRIDFSDIGSAPFSGEMWRINLFRIDKHPHKSDYTAWTAPLVGDFHALDRFGVLIFQK